MTDIAHSAAPTDDGGLRDRSEAAASAAREQAVNVAGTAQDQLKDVTHEAAEQAKAVVADAKRQTRRLVDESRQQLTTQAQEQTTRLAGGVRDVGQQLQGMARGTAAPQGIVADLATQAADMATQLADTLEQRRPEELLDELRGLARRRPGAFLLGAMGAGLLVGRLIRAVDTQSIVEAGKSAITGDGTGSNGDSGAQPSMFGSSPAPLASAAVTPGATAFGQMAEELSPAVRP